MSYSSSAKTVRVAVAEKGGPVNFCPTLLLMSSVLFSILLFFLFYFYPSVLSPICFVFYLVISFIIYILIPTFFLSLLLSSVCIISKLTPTS
jgi:hypothetical protein